MKKKKRILVLSLTLVIFVCLLFATGCAKGVNSKKAIKTFEPLDEFCQAVLFAF